MDWMSGRSEDCNAPTHSFPEEMKVQEAKKTDNERLIVATRWCLAYYKMCFFCYEKKHASTADIPDFNASSFGVNPDEFGGRQTTQRTGRQKRARQALSQRFGNRAQVADPEPPTLSDNSWQGAEF